MEVKAEIITIGDEILTGHTVNTNAAVLGQKLLEVGVEPRWTTVVSDRVEDIADAVARAARRADAVIVTGGLGPTEDDCTRQGVAAAAGVELEHREDLLTGMRQRWQARGLEMPGPPVEMRGMLDLSVLPGLESRSRGRTRKYRIVHTFGWPESRIADVLAQRLAPEAEWSLAYLPHAGGVDLRVGCVDEPAV